MTSNDDARANLARPEDSAAPDGSGQTPAPPANAEAPVVSAPAPSDLSVPAPDAETPDAETSEAGTFGAETSDVNDSALSADAAALPVDATVFADDAAASDTDADASSNALSVSNGLSVPGGLSVSNALTDPAGPPDMIGTPLTPNATRVMVLGSGELGKEVIIAFQRLGVEVIAVDRYADAPGHQVAHHAEVVDMTDPVALRAVIDRYRPHYVVPEIEAIATEALAEVEAAGVSEVIPTAGAVIATMNREGIRRLADEELGLPTSPYLFADTFEDFAVAVEQIGYPCVVKPVMSSSGKGQSVLSGPEDIESAWQTAVSGARVSGDRVIIEGFIEFDYEITLLTVRAVDPITGKLVTHFCAPIGHEQVAGDYVESWQPHEMSPDALASATSIAARVATSFGDGKLGGRGIFGVELFIKGDDVYFSEVSPRPHDTGLVTMATQRLSEFEMHARAILGLPVDVTLASPGASAVIYGQLEEDAIGFADVARALTVPETDVRLFGKPVSHHRRRMGVVTATADDVVTARRRAVAAASIVSPESGRPVRRVSELAPVEPIAGVSAPAPAPTPVPAPTPAPLPPRPAPGRPAGPPPGALGPGGRAPQPIPAGGPVPGRPPMPGRPGQTGPGPRPPMPPRGGPVGAGRPINGRPVNGRPVNGRQFEGRPIEGRPINGQMGPGPYGQMGPGPYGSGPRPGQRPPAPRRPHPPSSQPPSSEPPTDRSAEQD